MKVVYGNRSQAAFDTLDMRLQRILLYIKNVLCIDHSILEGYRDKETQDRYYEQRPRITTLKWPHSAHNHNPSYAVDVVPYVRIKGIKGGIHWNNQDSVIREKYYKDMVMFATTFKMVGLLLFQTEVTLGMDWNNNYTLTDEGKFTDFPHIELSRNRA